MNKKEIIEKTKKFVKNKMKNDRSGHDWWHIERVCRLAKRIAKKEGGDLFIIEMAALLHDIEDFKLHKSSAQPALTWLKKLNIRKDAMQEIYDITKNVSFKGVGEKNKIKTIEGKIVQDADRLDALGAIAIARTFAFGAQAGRPIHDPKVKPIKHKNFREYKTSQGTSVNHFYEKLLLLKDLMNTKTGKRLAQERHKFLKAFLEEFHKEWAGRV